MLLSNYFEGSVTKLKVEIMGKDILNFIRMKSLYCLCKLEISLWKCCCQNIFEGSITYNKWKVEIIRTGYAKVHLEDRLNWVMSDIKRA
jgi:hypothetical protein